MVDENQMDQGAPLPPRAGEKAQLGVSHTREATGDLPSAAGATTAGYRERAEGVWDDARGRIRSFQHDSGRYVRENPTKAVFTALGIGFLLGFGFRR